MSNTESKTQHERPDLSHDADCAYRHKGECTCGKDSRKSESQHTTHESDPAQSTRSSHTPGPWVTNVWTTGRRTVETANGASLPIAEIFPAHGDEKANAHLIAAAPALYEALEALLAQISRHVKPGTGTWQGVEEATEQARAALALVKGRQ